MHKYFLTLALQFIIFASCAPKLQLDSLSDERQLSCAGNELYIHCPLGPEHAEIQNFCIKSDSWTYPLCSRRNTPTKSWSYLKHFSLYLPASYLSNGTQKNNLVFIWQGEGQQKPPSCDTLCLPHDLKKHWRHKKKHVLFFGGSTMVDNGGEFSFPNIFGHLLETQYPGEFLVKNLASWSASMSDHIFNWQHFQSGTVNKRPYLAHIFFDGISSKSEFGGYYYLPQVPRQKFGAKDLGPHLVIIGQVWNDLFSKFFLTKTSIPVENGMPVPYLHQMAILNYAKHPSDSLAKLIERYAKILAGPKKSTKSTKNHLSFERALFETYRLLLENLITTIRQSYSGPIVLISLPFEINQNTPKNFIELKMKMALNLKYTFAHGADLKFWSQLEDVQGKVMEQLSQKFTNIFYLDLASVYHRGVAELSPKEVQDLGFFGDDLMHFGIWGNYFFADLLYQELANKNLITF